MKYYYDLSNANGAIAFFHGDGSEVIYTGTDIHREDEKYRPLGERYVIEKDIRFWFGAEGPSEDIYTIPRTALLGYDSRGGYLAEMNDRHIYIDAQKNCFLLPEAENILQLPNDWYDRREPMEPIHFFSSREEAQKVFPIQDARL